MNTSIYDTTTSFTMAAAFSRVTIEAFNHNGTLSSLKLCGIQLHGRLVNGGAIALNGGLSYFGYYAKGSGSQPVRRSPPGQSETRTGPTSSTATPISRAA